ncbi:MAG: N-acetylmuramoyl-L-alanine amidase [Myxococcota bacterium]
MLRAPTVLTLLASALFMLPIAAAPKERGKADPSSKLERALAKEKALAGDPKKLRLRENIEGLVAAFKDAEDEGPEGDRREAAEGELRALKLLAHWSGTAGDKRRAEEAQAALAKAAAPAPAPVVSAAPVKEAKPTDEALDRAVARAKEQRTALERLEIEPAIDSLQLVLPPSAELRARREILADKKAPRVLFDVSPLTASKAAATQLAVDHALVKRIRVSQLDAKTVRFVFDLNPARAVPPAMTFTAGETPRLRIADPSLLVAEKPAEKPALAKAAPSPAPAAPAPSAAAIEGSDPLAALIEIQSALDQFQDSEPRRRPLLREESEVESTPPPAPAVAEASEEEDRPQLSARMKDRPAGAQIRRIVIDAGHGGKDTGAIGKRGTKEKDINLAIALELGKVLEKKLGVEVVFTRRQDVYLTLQKRVQVANAAEGDLFLSVHSNAHRNRKFMGIETYYLNTTSNRYANRLAQRENAAEWSDTHLDAGDPSERVADDDVGALPGGAIGQDLRLLLADLAMQSATEKSRRLASLVQSSIVGKLKQSYGDVVDLGVKHALFYVLLGSRMPSILIESGFLSHPDEEKRLAEPAYQRTVAESIAAGVERFVIERNQIASRM